MFNLIKEADLSIDEAARVLRVSRVAVFNWKAKRSKPHPQLQERIRWFERFLERLLELNKLPLREGLSRDERRTKVERLKTAFEKYEG